MAKSKTPESDERRIPFGPQVFVRRLSVGEVQKHLRAAKLPAECFQLEVVPGGIMVRGKILHECASVIQAIADADAAKA